MADRRRGRAHGGQGGAEPRARIRLRALQVLDLAVAGRSQHQIATSLGITQPAVSKILRRLEERLGADRAYQVDRQRAQQTLRLQHLYGESMAAWDRSKQDAVRRRQRQSNGGNGHGATVAEIVAENQHGDPRFLEVARKTLGDLRSVWGLDAPAVIQAVSPYATMSDDALEAELAQQQRLLATTGLATAGADVNPVDPPAATRPRSEDADDRR
jgi:DNA-binding CsgD family transcriptional regulator